MPAKFEDTATAIGLVYKMVDNKLLDYLFRSKIKEWRNSFFSMIRDEFDFIDWGCTKLVFGLKELPDWVIKVGFRVNIENIPDFDSDEDQYDFCKKEYTNYCKAKQSGVADYFAEVEELCCIEGKTFYLQRRAICSEDKVSSKLYDYASGSFELADYETEEDYDEEVREYIYDGMDDYEKAIAVLGNDEQLIDFLLENKINDLHEGNFGYINDKDHYVIIDFSGYD